MSLLIKIPPKAPADGSPSSSQYAERPTSRHKATKRRVDSDEDGDDADADPLNLKSSSPHTRVPHSKKPKINPTPSPTTADPEAETPNASNTPPTETRFLPTSSSNPEKPVVRKAVKDQDAKSKRGGNRKTVQAIEAEDEPSRKEQVDAQWTPDPAGDVDDDDDDEDYEKERKSQRGSTRQRGTWRGKRQKGARGKALKELPAKDERKDAPPPTAAQGDQDTRAKRSRPTESRTDEPASNVDIVGEAAAAPRPSTISTTAAPEPIKEATPPPPPKKRKLPVIKKTKTSAQTPLATSSTPSAHPKPPTAPEPVKGPPGDIHKPTRVVPGTTDFDLRKPSVYAELFKPAGGIAPRSGLNRREKDEERRRELDGMKDEARAKRAGEAKYSFDLQEQYNKISRFEERLRQAKSPLLFPNFLAAKFKDDWERQQRKGLQRDNGRRDK